jgi:hypothetical protein
VRIIDFDDCGFGCHVMDIATSPVFLLTRAMSYVGWCGSRPEEGLAQAEEFLKEAQ